MVCIAFFTSRLLSPNHPNPEKQSSYECGEEPTGSAWLPFNSRFYVIALVFLLFDVEMVFVFPWSVVFGSHELKSADPRWGWLALTEMFIFLGILILGLVYVCVKGDLDWIKPNPVVPVTDVVVPMSLYEKLNQEQSAYKIKPFAIEIEPVTVTAAKPAAVTADTPIKKPIFKPAFKKPANEQ